MYQLKLHKNLTLEKWSKFPKHRQILMIANELNRLINGLDHQSQEELSECMERAIELIDLTISCQKKSLRKELLRFRDLFVMNYLYGKETLQAHAPLLKSLFTTLLYLDQRSAKTI